MRKFLKNQKGVTMMEVLITVAILAIVVAPCLSAFVMAQRGNVKAKQTFEAYTAASNLMDELKGLEGRDANINRLNPNAQDDPNASESDADGLHVLYLEKMQYFEVWIYAGEKENQPYNPETHETVPEGYIVKGVIALD